MVSIIWGKGPGVGLTALQGLVAIIPGECTRDLNTRRVLHGAGQGDGRQLHAAADLVKGRFALGISHDDAVSPGGVTVGLGVLAIPIDDKGVDAQLGGSDGLECIGGQMGVCLIVQVRSAKGGALLYCVEVGGEGCDGMVSACALGVQGGQVTGGGDDALAGVLVHPVSLKGLQRLVISLQIEVYLIHAFLIAGNIEDDGVTRLPIRAHGAETVVGVFQLQLHPDAVGVALRIRGGVSRQGSGFDDIAAGTAALVLVLVINIAVIAHAGLEVDLVLSDISLVGSVLTALFHRIEAQQVTELGRGAVLIQRVGDVRTADAAVILRCVCLAVDDPHGGDFHIDGQRPCDASLRSGGGGDGGFTHLVCLELIVLNRDNGAVTGLPVGEGDALDGRERLGGAVLHGNSIGFQLDPLGVVGLSYCGVGHSGTGTTLVFVPAIKDAALFDGSCQFARLKLGVRRKGAAIGNGQRSFL